MSIDATPNAAQTADGNPRARVQHRSGHTKPADIARWERDHQCVIMRRAEIDWDTITERLGYASKGHAHNRWVAMMREYPRDDVEAMRDLELDRIEKTCRALEPLIAKGDEKSVRAAEVWAKLSERRSKLAGIDKPERREVTVLTDDVVQKSIREATEQRDRKMSEARELGIVIPMELSPSGVFESVENERPDV